MQTFREELREFLFCFLKAQLYILSSTQATNFNAIQANFHGPQTKLLCGVVSAFLLSTWEAEMGFCLVYTASSMVA